MKNIKECPFREWLYRTISQAIRENGVNWFWVVDVYMMAKGGLWISWSDLCCPLNGFSVRCRFGRGQGEDCDSVTKAISGCVDIIGGDMIARVESGR